jgi:hypothetical protein
LPQSGHFVGGTETSILAVDPNILVAKAQCSNAIEQEAATVTHYLFTFKLALG